MPNLHPVGSLLIDHPLSPLIDDYTSAIARRAIYCSRENVAEMERSISALNKALKEWK